MAQVPNVERWVNSPYSTNPSNTITLREIKKNTSREDYRNYESTKRLQVGKSASSAFMMDENVFRIFRDEKSTDSKQHTELSRHFVSVLGSENSPNCLFQEYDVGEVGTSHKIGSGSVSDLTSDMNRFIFWTPGDFWYDISLVLESKEDGLIEIGLCKNKRNNRESIIPIGFTKSAGDNTVVVNTSGIVRIRPYEMDGVQKSCSLEIVGRILGDTQRAVNVYCTYGIVRVRRMEFSGGV